MDIYPIAIQPRRCTAQHSSETIRCPFYLHTSWVVGPKILILSIIGAELSNNFQFFIMAAWITRSPCPDGYGDNLFTILDPENVGVEPKIVFLTCIGAELLTIFTFSIMAAWKYQEPTSRVVWKSVIWNPWPWKCGDRAKNGDSIYHRSWVVKQFSIFHNGGLNHQEPMSPRVWR